MWLGQVPDRRCFARQRIGRIPSVTQRLETHRTGIDHQKAADETFAEADNLADYLKRHHRTKHARQRAEDSSFGARRHSARRRRLRKQTAISWIAGSVGARLVRADRGQRTIEGADRRGDERLPREIAGVGHEVTGGEIIGAVRHDVVSRYQIDCVRGAQPQMVCLDINQRIEPYHRISGGFDLGPANVGRCENDLALQVRQRHVVVVDHAKRADTGGRQIEQYRRTQSAGADDQHAGGLQFRLPRPSHFAQDDVTGIPFEFFGSKHRG